MLLECGTPGNSASDLLMSVINPGDLSALFSPEGICSIEAAQAVTVNALVKRADQLRSLKVHHEGGRGTSVKQTLRRANPDMDPPLSWITFPALPHKDGRTFVPNTSAVGVGARK